MLQAGLFDDSPHTREIIYNFMRLRALRVEVDVKLALGDFTLDQAAKYLEEKVPMDPGTARQEAIAFSTGPGQALTYQIGKLQITKFLAEARLQQGEKFNLRAFHDFVWKNGNVPISLQRWEYLGRNDEVRNNPASLGQSAFVFLRETCEEPAEVGEPVQVTQDLCDGMLRAAEGGDAALGAATNRSRDVERGSEGRVAGCGPAFAVEGFVFLQVVDRIR